MRKRKERVTSRQCRAGRGRLSLCWNRQQRPVDETGPNSEGGRRWGKRNRQSWMWKARSGCSKVLGKERLDANGTLCWEGIRPYCQPIALSPVLRRPPYWDWAMQPRCKPTERHSILLSIQHFHFHGPSCCLSCCLCTFPFLTTPGSLHGTEMTAATADGGTGRNMVPSIRLFIETPPFYLSPFSRYHSACHGICGHCLCGHIPAM